MHNVMLEHVLQAQDSRCCMRHCLTLSTTIFQLPLMLNCIHVHALQMRPSVQELLCMPYVSQYIQKYAEHVMQVPDDTGRAPSLNLDQLPIINQIRRYNCKPVYKPTTSRFTVSLAVCAGFEQSLQIQLDSPSSCQYAESHGCQGCHMTIPLITCRSVLQPVQTAALAPPRTATTTTKSPDAGSSPAGGGADSAEALSHSSEQLDPLSDAANLDTSPIAASPARRHNVGPESTWAVRQSAELEDLQAALDKQSFRRGWPPTEAPVASTSDTENASQDQSDDAEPR